MLDWRNRADVAITIAVVAIAVIIYGIVITSGAIVTVGSVVGVLTVIFARRPGT
jgi:hypothetical protein